MKKKFDFPNSISLTKYLRDFLDENVSDKLYIKNIYAKNVEQIYKDTNFISITERYNKIIVLGNYMKSNYDASRIVDINGICPTVKENHNTVTAIIDKTNKVRKLSVNEFGKLMGVKEEDIQKIIQTQSMSKARKQFGNSIVVDVMVHIFDKLFKELNN